MRWIRSRPRWTRQDEDRQGGTIIALVKKDTRSVGTRYEDMAAEYLLQKGYIILEKNYRNRQGEIDIIALQQHGHTVGSLVYVEIKYRNSIEYGDPLAAVDVRKQRRISRAASYHYAEYTKRKGETGCRFDVIGIRGDGSISHIENAFDYMG